MSDFKAKCTKIDFRWGSVKDPAAGAYIALRSPNWNKEHLLLRKVRGAERGKGGEGKVKGGATRGREWR